MVKKILGIIIILLIIGGVVWVISHRKQTSPQVNTNPNTQTFDPKNPNFIFGKVVKADADKVTFTTNGQTYTANIDVATILIKQAKDKNGVYTNVDAQPSEFKPGTSIAVYFTTPPKDNVYNAYKIQIVPLP